MHVLYAEVRCCLYNINFMRSRLLVVFDHYFRGHRLNLRLGPKHVFSCLYLKRLT